MILCYPIPEPKQTEPNTAPAHPYPSALFPPFAPVPPTPQTCILLSVPSSRSVSISADPCSSIRSQQPGASPFRAFRGRPASVGSHSVTHCVLFRPFLISSHQLRTPYFVPRSRNDDESRFTDPGALPNVSQSRPLSRLTGVLFSGMAIPESQAVNPPAGKRLTSSEKGTIVDTPPRPAKLGAKPQRTMKQGCSGSVNQASESQDRTARMMSFLENWALRVWSTTRRRWFRAGGSESSRT